MRILNLFSTESRAAVAARDALRDEPPGTKWRAAGPFVGVDRGIAD
jgi:hypothetical protein